MTLEGGSREVPTFLFACIEYICTTMANGRRISESMQQDLYGQPQVSFRPSDFNAAIWSHGYDVICEQAVRCQEELM